MTCRLSQTDWRDVFYNAVRSAPGGVADAAAFLTERRGRSIHKETLRARLRGVDGEWINLEMLELLTEWLQEKKDTDATAWLRALNMQFGLVAIELPPAPEGGWECEIKAISRKLLQLGVEGGRLNEKGLEAIADSDVDPPEADGLSAQIRAEVELLLRLDRNVRRLAGLEV